MTVIALRRRTVPDPVTVLGTVAASLGANQSIKFATLAEALIEPDGADFLKYGSSGVYDALRRQAIWIGRRNSTNFRYRGLVYDEYTHAWSNTMDLWNNDIVSAGHGYDHTAIDSDGNRYVREYDSPDVWKRTPNGVWTLLPGLGTAQIAGGLTWMPIGLVYNDRQRIKILEGSSWNDIETYGDVPSAYHAVSAYNPISQLLLFGGGNPGPEMKKMTLAKAVTDIEDAPENPGSSEDHGVFSEEANGPNFMMWKKQTKNWYEYVVANNVWNQITQSEGNGSSPQNGPPNLSDTVVASSCVAIPIRRHKVTMYIQSTGSGGDVWLYKRAA